MAFKQPETLTQEFASHLTQNISNTLANAYVVLLNNPNDMKKQQQAASALNNALSSIPKNSEIWNNANFQGALQASKNGDLQAAMQQLSLIASTATLQYKASETLTQEFGSQQLAQNISNTLGNAYAMLLNYPNDKKQQQQAAADLNKALNNIPKNSEIWNNANFQGALQASKNGDLQVAMQQLSLIASTSEIKQRPGSITKLK